MRHLWAGLLQPDRRVPDPLPAPAADVQPAGDRWKGRFGSRVGDERFYLAVRAGKAREHSRKTTAKVSELTALVSMGCRDQIGRDVFGMQVSVGKTPQNALVKIQLLAIQKAATAMEDYSILVWRCIAKVCLRT